MYQDTDSRKLKKSLNILIIDDSIDDTEIFKEMIQVSPLISNVFSATTLRQGIELAKRKVVDVVLLDLNLQESTGLDTFQIFHQALPYLAIVVMTGINDESLSLKALYSGAQDFIIKDEKDNLNLIKTLRYAFERQLAEEALREKEAELRRAHSIAKLGTWSFDLNINKVFASEKARNIYGLGERDFTIEEIQKIAMSEYRQALDDALNNLIHQQKPYDIEFQIKRPSDGQIRFIHSIADFYSEQNRVIGVIQDITQRKNLEAQILQLEKMESIGRLAGGIAHDFNNMLCVILGHGEHLLNRLNSSDPLFKPVSEIVSASKRSAELTSQLLIFSHKQNLQLKVINVNNIVEDLQKMLLRLIGENIKLIINIDPELHLIKADRTQIEQLIMNLVINSRDAMPNGGELIIETANVYLDNQANAECNPGNYIRIAVSDTGMGMSSETQKKIFEPFFTTKPVGEGTGMGLSTVYGIVHHANGYIKVKSELNAGSTFKIYLPVTQEQASPPIKIEQKVNFGEGQVILVVEDEQALRDLIETTLKEKYNYKIKTSSNGGEALLMVEEEGVKPDLVISDIVMPGMNGRVLFSRLQKTLPDLKVLFMSGYTDMALSDNDVYPFIQKPFTIKDLTSKISEIINSQ